MRTMETHEIDLSAQELQALAEGKQLTAPLGDNRRLILRAAVATPEDGDDAEETGETPDSPDDIQAGAEVDE